MELDHLVIATHDLEKAKTRFSEATTIHPADGGSHPGRGTRNALISFGDRQYLEILAPDPAQTPSEATSLSFPPEGQEQIFHWAIRNSDLPAVAARATAAGLKPTRIFSASRAQPGEGTLEWDLLGIGGHDLAGMAPFFIDWKDTPHPSEKAPYVGPLESLSLRLPPSHPLRAFLDPAPVGVRIVEGEPEIEVHFTSPRGAIRMAERRPAGFPF